MFYIKSKPLTIPIWHMRGGSVSLCCTHILHTSIPYLSTHAHQKWCGYYKFIAIIMEYLMCHGFWFTKRFVSTSKCTHIYRARIDDIGILWPNVLNNLLLVYLRFRINNICLHQFLSFNGLELTCINRPVILPCALNFVPLVIISSNGYFGWSRVERRLFGNCNTIYFTPTNFIFSINHDKLDIVLVHSCFELRYMNNIGYLILNHLWFISSWYLISSFLKFSID